VPRVRTFSFAPVKLETVAGTAGAYPLARPPALRLPRLLDALGVVATELGTTGGVLTADGTLGTTGSDIVLDTLQVLGRSYYLDTCRCKRRHSDADSDNGTHGVSAYSDATVQDSYLITNTKGTIGVDIVVIGWRHRSTCGRLV
jgi:hypothetical protein